MAERDDEGNISRRYMMSLESLAQTRIRPLDQPDDEEEEVAASKQPARNKSRRPTRNHSYTTSRDVASAEGPSDFSPRTRTTVDVP